MDLQAELAQRSQNRCELCDAEESLKALAIEPLQATALASSVHACARCSAQWKEPGELDSNHWRCLTTSMWSDIPAVQVFAWRILNRLTQEDWARDLMDSLFLDTETKAWAEAQPGGEAEPKGDLHRDSFGALLESGDTVTLVKDLVVKGAGFTAKRGTAVRGIALVPDQPGQIEGRVNGQLIVILTQFVKRST